MVRAEAKIKRNRVQCQAPCFLAWLHCSSAFGVRAPERDEGTRGRAGLSGSDARPRRAVGPGSCAHGSLDADGPGGSDHDARPFVELADVDLPPLAPTRGSRTRKAWA